MAFYYFLGLFFFYLFGENANVGISASADENQNQNGGFSETDRIEKKTPMVFFLIFFQWWRQSPKNEGSWGTGKKEFSLKPDKMSSESRERKLKVCGRVKQPLSVPNFFYFPGNLLRLFRSHKRIIIKLIPQVKSLSGLFWRKKCTWPFFSSMCVSLLHSFMQNWRPGKK